MFILVSLIKKMDPNNSLHRRTMITKDTPTLPMKFIQWEEVLEHMTVITVMKEMVLRVFLKSIINSITRNIMLINSLLLQEVLMNQWTNNQKEKPKLLKLYRLPKTTIRKKMMMLRLKQFLPRRLIGNRMSIIYMMVQFIRKMDLLNSHLEKTVQNMELRKAPKLTEQIQTAISTS